MPRVLSEEDRDEYFNDESDRKSNIELVRNPYISTYLLDKQNKDREDMENFQFDVKPSEFIPINQDVLYNDKVSVINKAYKYTDRIREASSIRYVRSGSELISPEYKETLEENGADDEEFLVPFDYVLVTRRDGSQFMIVEDFSNTRIPRDIHKYSIIRYAGERNPFKLDSIYSDGIDLSRILTNDNRYIDVFANNFLSEYRLNESLLSTYGALDSQNADETDHGGGYVGYIDANTLKTQSSMEKGELLMFEKVVNGRSIRVWVKK